ncbi:MAG TPA: hypothetical protein V6D25_26520 [Leptolyngbyaceae cyanobacterium]
MSYIFHTLHKDTVLGIGDWVLGTGDWGLGTGTKNLFLISRLVSFDYAQLPRSRTTSPSSLTSSPSSP